MGGVYASPLEEGAHAALRWGLLEIRGFLPGTTGGVSTGTTGDATLSTVLTLFSEPLGIPAFRLAVASIFLAL